MQNALLVSAAVVTSRDGGPKRIDLADFNRKLLFGRPFHRAIRAGLKRYAFVIGCETESRDENLFAPFAGEGVRPAYLC